MIVNYRQSVYKQIISVWTGLRTDGLDTKKMSFEFFQSMSIIENRTNLSYLIVGGMDGADYPNHT